MTRGWVREDWAGRRHPKWVEATPAPSGRMPTAPAARACDSWRLAVALGDAGSRPVIGALDQAPLELRALGLVGRHVIGGQLDPHLVHGRLGAAADLVAFLGDDRHRLDAASSSHVRRGESISAGVDLAAGEDAEVDPDLERRLLVCATGNHEGSLCSAPRARVHVESSLNPPNV